MNLHRQLSSGCRLMFIGVIRICWMNSLTYQDSWFYWTHGTIHTLFSSLSVWGMFFILCFWTLVWHGYYRFISSCSWEITLFFFLPIWCLHVLNSIFFYWSLNPHRENSFCISWRNSSKICQDLWSSCIVCTAVCNEWWIFEGPQPTDGIFLKWSKCWQD